MKERFSVWCLTSVKGKELITWSWHKPKRKACAVGQNGLWPSSTNGKKKPTRNTKTVEKNVFWEWEIHILQLSCFHSGQNYCFPRLSALLGNIPVVSWRQYSITKPSGHAGMSSCLCRLMKSAEVGNSEWCGKQRIPLPAKRNNSSGKKKYAENSANESCKEIKREQGSLDVPVPRIYNRQGITFHI